MPANAIAVGYAGLLAAAHLAGLAALFRCSSLPAGDGSQAVNLAGQSWMATQVGLLAWCLVGSGMAARWVALSLLVWCAALSGAQPYLTRWDCLILLLCEAALVAWLGGFAWRAATYRQQGECHERRLGARQFSLLHLMVAFTLLAVASAAWAEGWVTRLPEGLVPLVRYAATGVVLGMACLLGGWGVMRAANLQRWARLLALACCAGMALGLGAAVNLLGTLPAAVVWASVVASAGTIAVARYLPGFEGDITKSPSHY